MSGNISVSFVDLAVISFVFESRSLRFNAVVSGAKLVRWLNSRVRTITYRSDSARATAVAQLEGAAKTGQNGANPIMSGIVDSGR